MKKAVIYSRVSTEEQSYQSQIDDLQRYAKNADIEIVGIFSEKVSGYLTSVDRTEYDSMKEFVIQNNVDLIICWELSRFGRNSLSTLNEIDYYKKKNVGIYFKKENINTLGDDPTSKLLLTLLSSIAELERETIISRMSRGMLSSAMKGSRINFPILPYGFTSDENGSLQIQDEEAKYVQMMYEMCANGQSLRAIANKLNSLNVKTRKASLGKKKVLRDGKVTEIIWRTNSIRKILKSTLYKGERIYQGKTKIPIPQIVTVKLWDKVQKVFETHVGYTNATKYEYLFKGKIFCGVCGYIFSTRTERRYAHMPSYYACSGRKDKSVKCKTGQFNSDVIDNHLYKQLFKSSRFIGTMMAEYENNFNLDEKLQQISYYESEILKLEAKKKRVNNMYKEGYINDDEIKSEQMIIKTQTIQYENKVASIKKEIDQHKSFNVYELMSELLNETEFEKKREFVEQYVNKILVYPVEKYEFDFSKLTYADYWENGVHKLKSPQKNEKIIFLNVYAFETKNPLKIVLMSHSNQCYINKGLEYDSKTKTLKHV